MNKPLIQRPTESAVVKYKVPVEYANKQLEIFWLPDEINVEKDVQSILVDMSPSEKHGVLTTLRLFTLYELKAGSEFWGDRFTRIFPRPEFRRMSSVFSMFELAVHAPFYNKLNEALNVATDEFYTDYVKDPILKERMEFVDAALNDEDELYALGVFSMIEGAVLYSSFAFLKHFQANGKNKLKNVCAGISFSVRDENLHAEAGAWCFRELLKSSKSRVLPETRLKSAAIEVYDHEYMIIEKIFEHGEIEGITKGELQCFVAHRLNLCLKNLGVEPIFNEGINPVGEWFYKTAVGYSSHDFFSAQGKEYARNWNETEFKW